MSSAPSLPAQTPGMFVGGGGQGTSLTGECAEAAADCGLSEADFAPFEQVIEVVRAAQARCRAYDQARWLAERERSFDTKDTDGRASRDEERKLPRRPTPRERHLAQCVPAPIIHPGFFQLEPGNPGTNVRPHSDAGLPGAMAYDAHRAPAAPIPRGLTHRTGVHHTFSTLRPELLFPNGPGSEAREAGSALSSEELRQYRQARVREVLRSAQDEDQPRLRSTNLTAHTRPRQAESERRDIEQVLPEPPQLGSEAAPEASGSQRGPQDADDGGGGGVQRQAEGCVAAVMDAQEKEMQREVRVGYSDGFIETQNEAQAASRSAEREHDRARAEVRAAAASARYAELDGDRRSRDAAFLRSQSAVADYARAGADRRRAGQRLAALPALRGRALESMAAPPQERDEFSGRLPNAGTSAPSCPVSETTIVPDG